MDDIHARDIRGQEASNKKMVAKLNQMTLMSVNSNDTVQAQLEIVLARRQVQAKKREELSNDLKIVIRALESSEEVSVSPKTEVFTCPPFCRRTNSGLWALTRQQWRQS